ncbi:Tetratricopeptide repeat-like superfamily [Olea europaea subsp. europaea]|uniref:Tetratricopeptide repeat-like superfamily n=1 Tax=Olea europaea subsp. europaea TaxID=158383 RepID=A0A8S0RLU4_OLEEU|nr:Tetratricopeptide repeat-like superfamily [Olea europaea subsp. europaea]
MAVKVSTPCLNWSHSSLPQSQSSSQTLASAFSSPSIVRRSIISRDGALFCRYVHQLDRSAFFGTHQSSKLYRSRSLEHLKSRDQPLRRACSASMASFSDEEFSKKIKELALRFQLSDDEGESSSSHDAMFEAEQGMLLDSVKTRCENVDVSSNGETKFLEYQSFEILKPPDFPERDEIIPVNMERRANRVEIPLSLRMIKRKKQWQEGFRKAGELAYCSVNKAFSSMVFIIQELQSYTLQMRETLFFEDLQGILVRVQKEMHASFVWLFQQVFSHTPNLMVYVMILLANYSVYSMGTNAAIAAIPPVHAYAATTETVSVVEDQSLDEQKFDSSAVKTFKLSSSNGKTTSIGGGNGGGGKYRPASSGTDGDGRFDESGYHGTVVPDEVSTVGNPSRTGEEESTSGQVAREEDVSLWNSMVEETTRMQAATSGEALDHEMRQRLVSPVNAEIEADDYAEYFRTELLYQTGLAREPNNPLLLANFAQFLYLVAQDYDRAEDYFKRAAEVEPKDAEALNKYANFLWQVKKDLWAAEETYLEAIAAEPSNSYYAANYAHFLWNTGGEDTCFPLNSPDSSTEV